MRQTRETGPGRLDASRVGPAKQSARDPKEGVICDLLSDGGWVQSNSMFDAALELT